MSCRRITKPKHSPAPRHDGVLAQIGDRRLTATELDEHLKLQPASVQARYGGVAQRREYLDNMVRVELLAGEAIRRGLDQHPKVQRVFREHLIEQLIHQEVDSKFRLEDVSDADVERFSRENGTGAPSRQIRVSEIFTKDQSKADRTARLAREASNPTAFQALVTRHSEDEDSKRRGGDLGFFGPDTTLYPRPLVEAAFALGKVGALSPPIRTDRGWHILKLTDQTVASAAPTSEAKEELRRRAYLTMRAKRIDALVADIRSKVNVQIFAGQPAK